MCPASWAAILAASLALHSLQEGPPQVQDAGLTLDQALDLARRRAPAVLSARARIDEARGRLAGASVLLRNNPVVEMAAGARGSARGELEAEVGVSQLLELGGRRRARIEGAEAAVDRAASDSEEATRRLLRDVSRAFLRALHAGEGLRLAAAAESVGVEVLRAAQRRQEGGEVTLLDVNVARVSLARIRAQVHQEEALLAAASGELRILLGMGEGEPLSLAGDLRDRRRFQIDELIAGAPERPDLKALAAEAREAEAERRLGTGRAWPDLGLGLRYEREEGDDVLLGGITLVLPVFDRGQGLRGEAGARARRALLDLEAGRRAVEVEVRTAFEVYRRREEALSRLEGEALPFLDQNETLARRSYEAGQIGLVELMAVRRQVLEVRAFHLDLLLEAALSGVELQAAAGVLR